MAEFILREKEFRKLNELLDDEFKRSTLSKVEKFSGKTERHRIQMYSRGNEPQKFNTMNSLTTYTKSKGHGSGWMKKSGGGDYISPPKSPTLKTRKESFVHGLGRNTLQLGTNAPGTDVFVSPNLSRKQRKPRESDEPIRCSGSTNINGNVNSMISSRTISCPAKPIVVKYHNDKFTASPSLDNMIKESLEKLEESSQMEEYSDLHVSSGNKNGRKPSLSPNVLESKNSDGKNVKKIVNANGLIRFLKTKIALLEDNQTKSMQDMAQQKEAFDQINDRLKLTKQQRDKAILKTSTLTEQNEKLTNQLNEANRRSRERSQESIDKHKEVESLKRDLKQLSLSYKNLEARHTRTQEELESALKSQESIKNNERELKEKLRNYTDAKDAEIKYLKKQRTDLFAAYKRQLYLIDNLRQQNICMEQAKMIEFSEKEFNKVLEWNLKA